MTAEELEALLTERANSFGLKKQAFDTLNSILSEKPDDLIGGFEQHEIKTIFDGYQYRIDDRYIAPVIRARIGIYVENEIYLDNLEPIGYYDLESDLNGEIVDDCFVIEQEKYLKDIGITSYFKYMNEKMPDQYLRRNHFQYEFVAYISLIGTSFISKAFESAGVFISRANVYLATTDHTFLDKDYLKESRKFLKMMSAYLIENELVSENLKQKLSEGR